MANYSVKFFTFRQLINDMYSSSNIIRVTKSKSMRWVGHVACKGRGEVCTGF